MSIPKSLKLQCIYCTKEFTPTSGPEQKYCCHKCYIEHKSGPLLTLTCKICGTAYEVRGKRIPKFCSQECYNQARYNGDYDGRVDIPCQTCRAPIKMFPKDAKRSAYHFCSPECRQVPSVPVRCQECNAEFLTSFHTYGIAKFCSDECRNARNRREQVHKKNPTVPLTCEQCGKPFDVRRSVAKAQRYCSQKCSSTAIGERHQGENSPIWKGRVTITCDYCGEHFETFPSRANRSKYCCKDHSILGNMQRLASGARTNLEIAMATALSRCGVAFDEQVVMFDRFMVDFKLRDHAVIIQCDGRYWHERANVASRDRGQDRYLAKAGYVVLRFSDQEILKHIGDCLKRIKNAIETGQIPLINW